MSDSLLTDVRFEIVNAPLCYRDRAARHCLLTGAYPAGPSRRPARL